MNINLQNLSFKAKVALSSSIIGAFQFLGSPLPDDIFSPIEFGGIDENFWVFALFFGALMAWSELWKKDFKGAIIQFFATASIYLLLNGYSALLPEPLNILHTLLNVVPFTFIMLYLKIAFAQGVWRLNRKTTIQILLSALFISASFSYSLILLFGYSVYGDYFLLLSAFAQAPLFYLIFYRISEGKEWQDLFRVKTISKSRFVSLFLLTWSLLLVCLIRLNSVIPSFQPIMFSNPDIEGQMHVLVAGINASFYIALTILALGYLCSRLLISWHFSIKKPLGWLYALSFVPLVNILTVILLLRQKPDSWNNANRWHEHLEAERNKIATGLIVLTIIGSVASLVMTTLTNSQIPESSLYNSLIASALSAFTMYALYKGWASYWAIVAVYVVLYSSLLAMDDSISPQLIVTSVIARCLGFLIYYEAIKPTANKHLKEELSVAQNS